MEQAVKTSTARLLNQSIAAIRKGDAFRLKELSSTNVHSAAVFQDEDSLSISVVVYALSKIIEHAGRKGSIIAQLERALSFLKSGRDEKYRATISSLVRTIEAEDYRLKRFAATVIEQAQVKKGCALCEHGISLGRVSNLFGISRWELMRYLGKTRAAEVSSENIPTEDRLKFARGLFK